MPTTNRGYATPATGSEVGTWGMVINNNAQLIDNNLGAVATVTVSNTDITLAPNQYQCGTIRLVGTPTADVRIIFPGVSGWWTIENLLANATTRYVQIICGAVGAGEGLSPPPGVSTDIFMDGSNVKFRNMGKLGEYWFYSGTTAPVWLNGCSVPPYLICQGGTFSGSVYPRLAELLGGTTLPDFKGRGFFAMNQGSGRITTAGSGINGDALFSAGGSQNISIGTINLPPFTPQGTVLSSFSGAGSVGINPNGPAPFGGSFSAYVQGGSTPVTVTGTVTSSFTGNPQGGLSTPLASMPPAIIGGIVLIRAA